VIGDVMDVMESLEIWWELNTPVFVSSVLCLYGATGADGPASVLSEICECSRFHLLPIVTLFLKSDRLGV